MHTCSATLQEHSLCVMLSLGCTWKTLSCNDLGPNCSLNWNLELLPRYKLLQAFDEGSSHEVSIAPVHNICHGLCQFVVDLDVQTHQVVLTIPCDVVLHAGIPLAAALQLIEEVGHNLQRGRIGCSWRWRLTRLLFSNISNIGLVWTTTSRVFPSDIWI